MEMVTNLFRKYIPSNIPIFPMWGNHEDYPVDEYDFYGNNTDFLKNSAY